MNMDKLKKVFSEEAFVKSLFEMETVTEVQQALNSKGLQMSEEELLSIRTLFTKVESGEISLEQLENGEISEETLEQIAGGSLAIAITVSVLISAVSVTAAVGIIGSSLGLFELPERW